MKTLFLMTFLSKILQKVVEKLSVLQLSVLRIVHKLFLKYRGDIRNFVTVAIALFITYLITFFLVQQALRSFLFNPIAFLYWAVFYSALLVILYLSSSEIRTWLKNHELLFIVLGILIPISIFFLQQTAEIYDTTTKYEVSLKEENNRNFKHLESIVHDLENDPHTIFWSDFSLTSYYQYWDYIHRNYSQECKNSYATMIVHLGIINNINESRRQLDLTRPNALLPIQDLKIEQIDKSYGDKMLEIARTIKPIFSDVIKCQLL